MSDTPDTDAARSDYQRRIWTDRESASFETVPADFARKLERERDKMTAYASDLAAELRDIREVILSLRDVTGRHHTESAGTFPAA